MPPGRRWRRASDRSAPWSRKSAGTFAGSEYLADRLDFRRIAGRRRGGVRVDVVDPGVDRRQRHSHAALGAFAGRRRPCRTIGGCAVTDDLGVDSRRRAPGVLEFFQHHDARAPGDDKAVAADVSDGREAVAGVSLYFDDIAPIASNRTDNVQSSSSHPPAKITSCLPI